MPLTGRLMLVVGSECAALPTLGFVGPLAANMYRKLHELGGWTSAVEQDGPLLNPGVDELVRAVDSAFAAASARRATLLISYVGHGKTTGDENFYLLANDSPEDDPTLRNAFHLTQEIQERLARATLDGLIILVDACETGEGMFGATRRWPRAAGPDGRMELLVATGDGNAYNGCFTRTVVSTFEKGVPRGGESLLPADMMPALQRCAALEPKAFSYSAGVRTANSDPGLWLVPNIARRDDAVSGRTAAGFVDQLVQGLVVTDVVAETLSAVVGAGADRLRGVVGPAGCGKSTLMAALIRPGWVDGLDVAAHYITAAVFLDVTSSIESFAAELAGQLGDRLDGFKAASRSVEHELADPDSGQPDVFEIKLLRPLAKLGPRPPMHIVVDGLDQPEPGSRELLLAAVHQLTRHADLDFVRLIVGIRSGTGVERALTHMRVIEVPPPSTADIAEMVVGARRRARHAEWTEWIGRVLTRTPVGGWLLARLLIEVRSDITSDELAQDIGLEIVLQRRLHDVVDHADAQTAAAVRTVLGVLMAAGAGPVLPLELLESALDRLDLRLSTNRIRDLVASLGALVTRGHPGTPSETLGLAHEVFQRPLERFQPDDALRQAHIAIADALDEADNEAAARYARGSAVRHYLAYGNSGAAITYLKDSETERAADNRDRWAAWLPTFDAGVGPDHPDTLAARNSLGYWRGDSGDLPAAIAEHERLLADQIRVLGVDHPDTLTTRANLARWRAEGGDYTTALAQLEQLLVERTRLLGPDHRHTLRTRHSIAHWHGESGDHASAIFELQQLLADRQRVLGSRHQDTLRTRQDLARLRGETGDLLTAITEFQQLLFDQQRELGADHQHLFSTRHNLAHWHAESGDHTTAITEFRQLLADQQRRLGAEHPQTLSTRIELATVYAESGDHTTAIAEFQQLFTDQQRVLGPDHPHTLRTRNSIAYWHGESGNHTTAIAEFRQLLADELRVLGPDHQLTLRARHHIAHFHGASGHYSTAVAELDLLLPDRRRVLGPINPHTLRTREELAYWRGESGNVATAIAEYEGLLADREYILGPDHPDTMRTRHYLAYWHGESGQPATAVAEYERLLAHQHQTLGPDHPDTLRTRHNLAFFKGETGQAHTATAEFERLLVHQQRVLGADHPDTLRTRHNLAHWYGEVGLPTQAVQEYQYLLPIRLRVLGPDHPDTLRTRHNLARWRGDSNDTAGARAEYEQLLADRLRVLGAEHHDTLSTRHHLAYYRGQAGDFETALREYEQLLPLRVAVLGPDHPDCFRTRHNLAHLRGLTGNPAAAVRELQQVLADRTRVLGPKHPHTLRSRQYLANWHGRFGDLTLAITELERLLADQLQVLGPDHRYTLSTRHDLANWHRENGDLATARTQYETLYTRQLQIFGPTHPDTIRTKNHLATVLRPPHPR